MSAILLLGVLLGPRHAVPLRWSARSVTWLHHALHGAVGCVTVAIGCLLLYRNLPAGGSL